MHPFSVMQFFPTGRFITLCFYCFFWLKSFFRVQKNSPKAFGTGFEPPNKYRDFQATARISVRKSVHIENSYHLLPVSLLPPKITFPASRLPLSDAV